MRMEIKELNYKQSRQEYFLQKLREAERRLIYWERMKNKNDSYLGKPNRMCSEIGCEIGYLQDAIKALNPSVEFFSDGVLIYKVDKNNKARFD